MKPERRLAERAIRPEQVTGVVAAHGESPVWFPATGTEPGGLHCVDMTAGDVLRFGDGGAVERWHAGPLVTAVRPRTGGGYLLALERGIAVADSWAGALTQVAALPDGPDVRCNDIGCDPAGGLWFGTMAHDYAAGRGSLFHLTREHRASRVLAGIGVANGIDWTPDGGTAYFADTLATTIEAFDWSPQAGLTRRRPFAAIPVERGRPDGLAVDTDGGVWVALWSGGAVHRYRPDGALDTVIDVPAQLVTACTFGGPELDQLFITTIRGTEPGSGAIFRAEVGVRGQPARGYAG